jgi:hypothetical protein
MTYYIWFMDQWGASRQNNLTWEIFDALYGGFVGRNYNAWMVEVRGM